MLPFIRRAMQGGLAKVGEPSLLRGEDCGKVSLQRSVEIVTANRVTEDDNYAGLFDVVTISVQYSPQADDLLQHPDGTFRLDRLVHDNGAVRQFIVVAA